MAKRRLTFCMLIPFVIIVSVVGLFFTVTDPTSWPEYSMELSPTDMRLAPHISTVWCESAVMTSSEDFVAYRLARKPKIKPMTLTKHVINFKLKMDSTGRRISEHHTKYFLLPGSVINVQSCATRNKARVYIFKHDYTKEYFQQEKKQHSSSECDEDSDDDMSENNPYDSDTIEYMVETTANTNSLCSKALTYGDVPVTYNTDHKLECRNMEMTTVTYNVTSKDVYVIVVTNENHLGPNYVRLRIWLDRTAYNFYKLQKDMLVCGGPTLPSSCNVHLTFASSERVLIWVPPSSSLSTRQKVITINSQCRPRIALFALLTVLLPVFLFVIVSFVLKHDRKWVRDQRVTGDHESEVTNRGRNESFASPLLPEFPSRSSAAGQPNNAIQTNSDNNNPPSYEALFDLPPSYSSLKLPSSDKSRINNSS